MAHSSIQVADRILVLAKKRQIRITPMKLLKLVYICHGWMLGLYRRPLIREQVQAWKFGPIIPELYGCIKHYRDNPINQLISQRSTETPFNQFELDVINQVCNLYFRFDDIALSNMTHQPGTPWSLTSRESNPRPVITNKLIADYYGQLAQSAQAA